MNNRPGPTDHRGRTGAGWVALVVVAVVAAGMAALFGVFQSWKDLTSGQATLLASGGVIVAPSIALWAAWVTRRGAQINTEDQKLNTEDQKSAEQDRLHQQLQAQTDQLDKQLAAQ